MTENVLYTTRDIEILPEGWRHNEWLPSQWYKVKLGMGKTSIVEPATHSLPLEQISKNVDLQSKMIKRKILLISFFLGINFLQNLFSKGNWRSSTRDI